MARAHCSLEGLLVGDAFGEQFFLPQGEVHKLLQQRAVPAPPWPYTDDTQIAMSIVAVLRRCGTLDQDLLARSFARHYDPFRGYGMAMHDLLPRVRGGEVWREASGDLFGGQGSFGNGAAMRVASLGAYFADNLHHPAAQAARSAEVTHSHPEGIAGAVAVAVAAAVAWHFRASTRLADAQGFIDQVLEFVPESEVRLRLRQARDLSHDTSIPVAASLLGNGSEISAQDTVPFALWCSATRLQNYEDALWATVSGLGDSDTTCAIVGGVTVMYTSTSAIPLQWLAAREPLPEWDL